MTDITPCRPTTLRLHVCRMRFTHVCLFHFMFESRSHLQVMLHLRCSCELAICAIMFACVQCYVSLSCFVCAIMLARVWKAFAVTSICKTIMLQLCCDMQCYSHVCIYIYVYIDGHVYICICIEGERESDTQNEEMHVHPHM